MSQLAQKQDYLSKQILQNNYDPEDFQDFMANYSNKDLDLHSWTLQQLKDLVQKFKHQNIKHEQEAKDNDKQFQVQMQMSAKRIQSEDNNKDEAAQLQVELDSPQYQKMSQSKASVNSSLYKFYSFQSKTNLPQLYTHVHIQNKPHHIQITTTIKTTQNNLFKSSYILYQIQTSLGFKTRRRFSDFVWLHQFLKKSYEGQPIPPIPSKTTMRSFDEKHIEYRMDVFEKFLNTLVRIPEICSDHVLQMFLKSDDESFTKQKQKLQQELQSKEGSGVLENIWGQDMVLFDQFQIPQKTQNFYRDYSNKLSEVSSQLCLLIDNLKKTSSQCFSISSNFQGLQGQLCKIPGSQITGLLQQYCNGLGMYLSKASSFIKQSIHSVWNYQNLYIQNIVSSISKSNKQRIHMNDKIKHCLLKVQEQGNDAFTNSLQPNRIIKQIQMAKQVYRIKLSYLVRQIKRYENEQMIWISKEWGTKLRQFIRQISDWMINCTDILTKSISVSQGKKLIQVEYLKQIKS